MARTPVEAASMQAAECFDSRRGAEAPFLLRQDGAAAHCPTSLYRATWDTVEDEELPLLDSRLAAAAAGRDRDAALGRMAAMAAARHRRREAAFWRAGAAARKAGLDPLGLMQGAAERRDPRRRPLDAVLAAIGAQRRSRDLRGELLLHAAGIETLDLLQGLIDHRPPPDGGSMVETALLTHSACAAAASLFSGFNIAYLAPRQSYQAGALAAAAWLGWKLEGRHAPLPAEARRPLRIALESRAAVLDAYAVLRLGLDAAGLDARNLEQAAHEHWPSPRTRIDLRPRGMVDAAACEALRALLRAGPSPC